MHFATESQLYGVLEVVFAVRKINNGQLVSEFVRDMLGKHFHTSECRRMLDDGESRLLFILCRLGFALKRGKLIGN
jgi:hypothetical protein